MPNNYSTIEHQAHKQTPKTQTKIVLTIRVVLTLENHNIISYGKKGEFSPTLISQKINGILFTSIGTCRGKAVPVQTARTSLEPVSLVVVIGATDTQL